jgi:hypothetical protein
MSNWGSSGCPLLDMRASAGTSRAPELFSRTLRIYFYISINSISKIRTQKAVGVEQEDCLQHLYVLVRLLY